MKGRERVQKKTKMCENARKMKEMTDLLKKRKEIKNFFFERMGQEGEAESEGGKWI